MLDFDTSGSRLSPPRCAARHSARLPRPEAPCPRSAPDSDRCSSCSWRCAVAVTSLGGPAAPPAAVDRINQIIKRMTLEEKVGQLFVTYVYGQTADTTDPADVAQQPEASSASPTAGADREVPPRRRHLLRLVEQRRTTRSRSPACPTGCSGSRPVAARRVPLLIATDQEHGVVTRVGPPATQFPGNMALGAGRSTERRVRRRARSPARSCAPSASTRTSRRIADVNVNPAEPGHRRPVLRLRPDAGRPIAGRGQVAGYQDARRRPRPPSTSRATATPRPTATTACRSSTTPASEWEQHRRPAVPGGDRARHRLDHDRAHRRAGARPVRRPGHAVASRSSPACCAASWATTASSSPTRSTWQGVRDKYGDDRIPVLALKAGVDQLLMPAPGKLDIAYNAVLDAVALRRADREAHRRVGHAGPAAEDEARPVRAEERHRRRVEGRPIASAPPRTWPRRSRSPTAPSRWSKDDADAAAAGRGRPQGAGHRRPASPTGARRPDRARGATPTALDTGTARPTRRSRRRWRRPRHERPGRRRPPTRRGPAPASRQLVAARCSPPASRWSSSPCATPTTSPTSPTRRPTWRRTPTTAISMESLARVLFGEVQPRGKLPVDIPAAADPGTVLYPFGHGLTSIMTTRMTVTNRPARAPASAAGGSSVPLGATALGAGRGTGARPACRCRRPGVPAAGRSCGPAFRCWPADDYAPCAGRRSASSPTRPACCRDLTARGRRHGGVRRGRPGRRVRPRARLPRHRAGRRLARAPTSTSAPG